MSDLPANVLTSRLWKRLTEKPHFQVALSAIRQAAEAIASHTSELIPGFTDHSVVHMDALWTVADEVLSAPETGALTVAEAFVLGSAFYVHDLGMAIAGTTEGWQHLVSTDSYEAALDRLQRVNGLAAPSARAYALRIAARDQHAQYAEKLVSDKLPGLDRFLIESTDLRGQWGAHIGGVAASHHWPLQIVEKKLGSRSRVPTLEAGTLDLGYIACVLRIVDYAHINGQRATVLDRLLRSEIPDDSLIHWIAQQNVTGPTREGNQLVFGCSQPISLVDAWWTFFEMAVGLDREISAVAEYLGARAVSVGRFSLDSVRGVGAPVTFATLVQPVGFEPVDVRFRPDSMDRLVEILGGKTLYGDDHFATIRELLQNASDAIHLQRSVSSLTGDEVDRGKIIVTLESDGDVGTLSVADSGIGMSEKVITNYLLGVAADYWNSPDFFADFPGAKASGFLQVGRFGIGFLSVFMLGKDVRVVSERVAGERLVLNLRGLGRRGALVREPARGSPGTTVRVILEGSQTADHRQLARIIRAKAPMLDIPVEVRELGQAEQISPKWWESLSQDQFVEFLKSQSIVARQPNSAQRGPTGAAFVRHFAPFAPDERDVRWRGAHPEIITENYRVLAWPGARGMLLCSKGFAIDWVHSPGLLGLAEIGDVQLNAARSSPLGWDWRTFQDSLLAELTPRIVAALDAMKDELSIPRRYAFLSSVGSLYGANTLKASSLPWVTVVEPPGTATLVSAQEFLSKARQVDELGLVIGADVSPWSATTLVHQRYPETGRRALVVPIDTSSFNVPFNARDGTDVITGTLDALFSSQDRSDVVRRMPLLAATLGLVAEAWAVPVQRLEGVSWSKRLRTLCTRLVRV